MPLSLRSRQNLRYWLTLLPLAFALNGAWEYLQCAEFFVHGTAPNSAAEMLLATLGDVALTVLTYAIVAAITRNASWGIAAWTARVWISLLGLALILSASMEFAALTSGRWSYTPAAPLLPLTQLSIVPILQLVILLPLSLRLARVAALHSIKNC
jgi:hypothetical protein